MSRKNSNEWKQKGEHDYKAMMILSRQRKNYLPESICFHAHQCVEKHLKGLLVKNNVKIKKTHDLVILINSLKKKEPELELSMDILNILNRYAVELRYPGESATKTEAKEAVKQVKQIRQILLDLLS